MGQEGNHRKKGCSVIRGVLQYVYTLLYIQSMVVNLLYGIVLRAAGVYYPVCVVLIRYPVRSVYPDVRGAGAGAGY